MERIDDGSRVVGFENPGSSKLANLLGRLGYGQVAGPALAVLHLARCGHSESFLGRFVGFLLGHNEIAVGSLLGNCVEGTKV